MTPNPFVNAFGALAYITTVASIMFYISHAAEPIEGIIIPVSILSLFVLSAAMMGYFFVFQPILFLFEGKLHEAKKFFLSTVAIFACITGAALASLSILSPY